MSSELDRSYAWCRAVVRRSSSNLAWCFWLLPRDQRRGMDALYAFARRADDLVDREGPLEERQSALQALRRDLTDAIAGAPKPPLLPAVADTLKRFAIPSKLLEELLDGMAMDLTLQVPASFAELYLYCYRAASVVGLACLPIWGCTDERATQPAIDCGIAFQLTNILRDLKEDANRGRCYLPRDELERFGVGPACPAGSGNHDDLGASSLPAGGAYWLPRTWDDPLAKLVEFQIARARSYYESAAETARYLPPPGRRVFALMVARYRSILAAIEREPPRILRERVSLSWPRKAVVAIAAILGSGFGVQVSRERGQKLEVRGQQSGVREVGINPKSEIRNPKSDTLHSPLPSVAIVGGGLAGLAAAVALCQRGVHVELFETRQRLGGRAGSYVDRESGDLVDHCQHVAMGCCTSFLDFCRQTKIDGLFTRHRTLHFFGPEGKRCDLSSLSLLPAPLHLAPALFGQTFLSRADRRAIAWAMLRLARLPPTDKAADPTIGQWLVQQGQSPAAIEQFWQVVLVSALGESLDRASLAAARKVFVDGFMAARSAYEVLTPAVPLGELYDELVAQWLRRRGVTIHLGCGVEQIVERNSLRSHDPEERNEFRSTMGIALKDGTERPFDFVISAVPWRRLSEVLSPALAAALPRVVSAARNITSSPITGIHLWFDRPITELPHAVIVGRLAQWVFARNCGLQIADCGFSAQSAIRNLQSAIETPHSAFRTPHWYYQVVISASRNLAGRDREEVLGEVLGDLNAVFPESRDAKLLRWQMVTDQEAVFSVRPGLTQLRPPQRTEVPSLFLAGDWTATGWPATMEGAVRSGYLSAEGVMQALGRRQRIVSPDLPRGWLARWLIRNDDLATDVEP